jgi:hypothetical protein
MPGITVPGSAERQVMQEIMQKLEQVQLLWRKSSIFTTIKKSVVFEVINWIKCSCCFGYNHDKGYSEGT